MRGFTLIELLIVVAILGILALAALSAINPGKRQNQAKDSQIKADIGQIATALSANYTSGGKNTFVSELSKLLDSGDLKNLPNHPDGSGYVYIKNPPSCVGTIADLCTDIAVRGVLYDDDDAVGSDTVWCWQSSLGKATEVLLANCTAP